MHTNSTDKSLELLQRTTRMLSNYIQKVDNQERKVINFFPANELKEIFDFSITNTGISTDELFSSMQDVLDKSIATYHTRFFNQLYAGADIYGIIGERMTAVLNTSMYTYEVGPLFTLMEEYIFGKIAKRVGRTKHFDGMMLPGGSTSNLYGIQLARYNHNKQINKSGLYGHKPLLVFTSDQSHYSITKAVMLMGLGKDSIVTIKTNDAGAMIASDLEEKIKQCCEEDKIPLMINATSGTTVLGAYDPIDQISVIAKKYGVWLHVDAIWGGGVLLHDQLISKMKGIEHADSFSWNPHKMIGSPLQSSIFMTQRPDLTSECNTLKAQYLFNSDKGYGVGSDTGDKYVQCGRRVDVLKLWLQRKAEGDQGVEKRIDTAFNNTQKLVKKINESQRLYLVMEPECTNICFWYLPSDIDKKTVTHEIVLQHFDRIHTITAQIKHAMMQRGEMMTGYAPAKGLPNFIRMILLNPKVTEEDLDFVVSHIQELGKEIEEDDGQ